MSNPPKLQTVYWDSCIFIAWLKNEVRPLGELEGIRDLALRISKNEINLAVSVMARAEILRSMLPQTAIEKFDSFMKRRNVHEHSTDSKIWALAHDLRDYYQKLKDKEDLPTLTLPDAVHCATAIHLDVDTLYTFDEKNEIRKRRALIPLSGNVAGYPLSIKKPDSQVLGLFDAIVERK